MKNALHIVSAKNVSSVFLFLFILSSDHRKLHNQSGQTVHRVLKSTYVDIGPVAKNQCPSMGLAPAWMTLCHCPHPLP